MPKKLTLKQFVDKAIAIWGDRYDYSNVVYVNSKTKVEIICKVHGSFFQIPSSHLRKSGCSACSGNNKRTTKQFITEAIELWGDRYDYSKSIYIDALSKVEIICKKHGSFFQGAKSHLNGFNGCKGCTKHTIEDFIAKAIAIWGDRYDYSNVVYVNSKTKVEIICKVHGSFLQTPCIHTTGSGCPLCHSRSRWSTPKFIAKAIAIWGDRYDYSNVVYVNSKTKVEIICKVHGSFLQKPNDHMMGNGCPSCSSSSGEEFVANYLKDNGVVFEVQKTFDGCKHKQHLRFDFFLPTLNAVIEYNGKQHYEPVEYFGGDEGFKARQVRDNIKAKYCSDNGIILVVIHYSIETPEDIANYLKSVGVYS